jgi:hypothetical protein
MVKKTENREPPFLLDAIELMKTNPEEGGAGMTQDQAEQAGHRYLRLHPEAFK